MGINWKHVLYGAGSLVALTGVGVVGTKLYDEWGLLEQFSATAWFLVGGLMLAYGTANFLIANGWKSILAFYGIAVSFRWSAKITGIYQVTKYIPGNIFHMVGRQALGVAAGLPGWPLAKSTIWELALLAVTGASFSVLLTPLISADVDGLANIILFISSSLVIILLASGFIGRCIGLAVLSYFLFLIISGVIFILILRLTANWEAFDLLNISIVLGAFVLAWLAGMITPGAPAGIGVRELILLYLLGGLISESDLLLATVISRIVTVGGDLLFFAFSFCVPRKRTGVPSTTTSH